jgi:hypothetical protein
LCTAADEEYALITIPANDVKFTLLAEALQGFGTIYPPAGKWCSADIHP